ncbi:MAG: hypothetical protein WCC57_19430 [Paracoccaceae bacterium]
MGLSRGAVQKAKEAVRLVLHADGSIDATASDTRRATMTDPAKKRGTSAKPTPHVAAPSAPPTAPKLKSVPDAALSAVSDTLCEQGLVPPATGGNTTFLQARTANEVLKAQERRIKLAQLKDELIDRDCAVGLVFRLAREERDA